jgi:4-hydroxybenzoate polyprenyltransferase
VASAIVYIVNDIADRERDRLHTVKRRRPIAAGRVSPAAAVVLAGVLVLLLGASLVVGPWRTAWPVAVYLLLNLAYSRWLKHLPIVDVFVVATGFVLRMFFGWLATGMAVSSWLVLCVFTGSLLLSFGKRRHELSLDTEHRATLKAYSKPLLDQLLLVSATLSVVAYLGFLNSATTAQPFGRIAMFLTVPFGIFAVFRYLQILLVENGGGNPTRILLRDVRIAVSGLLCMFFLGMSTVLANIATVARLFTA